MESKLEYFTLEEESEVEEFVAEDPNYRKKVFWFDLVEKGISGNSKHDLILNTIFASVSLTLQIKLITFYIWEGQYVPLVWTLTLAIFAGSTNVLIQIYHNKNRYDTSQVRQEIDLRYHTLHLRLNMIKTTTIIRSIFAFCLVSPIFNLSYYWSETEKCSKNLRRPLILRSQPQPSIAEIQLVEKHLEISVRRCYRMLLESVLNFIPFALAQIFIVVHYFYYIVPTAEQKDIPLGEYGIRAYLILWNMFIFCWNCTKYSTVYHNYTKALQFHDLREFEVNMHLILAPTGIRELIPFFNNFVSMAFRLSCLTILMSTLHFMTLTFFIPIVYISFHLVVNTMPQISRFRFENAQLIHSRGLTLKSTDLISRWINIFCCHDLKFQCHFHYFTLLFSFFYAVTRVGWIVAAWTDAESDSNSLQSYDHNELGNTTTTLYEFAQKCQESNQIPIPILNTITTFVFELLTMATRHCSQKRNIFEADFGIVLLFGIQLLVAFGYLTKSKTQVLFESEFPVQIAHQWWGKWFTKDLDPADTLQLRKILLCIILTNTEILNLGRHFRNWTKIFGRNESSKLHHNKGLEAELDKLWEKWEKHARIEILSPTNARLEQLIERRRVVRNQTDVDQKLNQMLEFVTMHYELDIGTLTMILYAVTNFDTAIQQSSSLRLATINQILK